MVSPTEDQPRRGRPVARVERKVVLQVLVRPTIKQYLTKAARAQGKTMSSYVNEILEHFHQGR